MSGCNHLRPHELIERRKIISDYKSDTDDLTIENGNNNANAAAYNKVRDKKDVDGIKKLMMSDNYSDLAADLIDLELLEEDSING